ncbi:MAG: hypothetical protein V4793_15930 [Paraburkholderia tropica]|uniref:Transcriptional regulator n=1 Tax=Paraburkholderia tropica TaxID=92647 RepID=A0ABX5MB73_9BURK|nr:hypothetical protein [Paraburkholderia tropica]MBB3004685.1 hypothetical protein [Paraburkholderia tropica]MBB6323483.1 hypothetical protein [Paraburkholderia tropica]PXX03455.1 hypothetical protein C7400_1496 [Paraburkholderia tropica]PZW69374.1 hypothetical protein C7399_1496 [Paraburkholderia tropica]QNB17384.1 hypothetical protein G5S35_37925 [Paraburkholderia tropica]
MTYKTFTLGDLRALLAPLSGARRAAVLYALDTHTNLDRTVMLEWKEALRAPTTEFARDLIRIQPRHLRLDYVFWEYLENGSAAPLFCLEDSVSEVTMGRSFADLQALYDRMIWIDAELEADSFSRDLKQAMEG